MIFSNKISRIALRASTSTGLSVVAMLAVGAGIAFAKGGTAKPPPAPAPGGVVPVVTILPPSGPTLLTVAPTANQFSISGHIQNVTSTAGCPGGGSNAGGTVTVNGVVITIPTDTIVQYPANTLVWADAVCSGSSAITTDGSDGSGGPGPGKPPRLYPGVEVRVDGNIVNTPGPGGGTGVAGVGSVHVAGLVYMSQHSVNSGSGYISFIDYTDGSIYVSSRAGAGGLGSEVRLLINDPRGRFGRPQTSTDARFSVDDANPTIKAAASGYPMCVPRAAPAGGGAAFATIVRNGDAANPIPLDPLCPQVNRPAGAGNTCRTFANAGVNFRIAGADMRPAPINGFCAGFVMKALTGMPGTATLVRPIPPAPLGGNNDPIATPGVDPDPRQQAPFEVGDFITWAGTLVSGGNANPALPSNRPTTTGAAGAGDVVWVHTIDANVGIYTQPATLPAYIAVGALGIGVDPQPTGVAVVGVETTARLVLEANTSDVGSLVDIYLDDKGFALPLAQRAPGVLQSAKIGPLVSTAPAVAGGPVPEYFRWMTLENMTGALAEQTGGRVPTLASSTAQPFGGGIETQFVGPQPGRARIRAIKIPSINGTAAACPSSGASQNCGVTNSPTRYMRVVLRSLCAPAASGAASLPGSALATVPSTNMDEGTAATAPQIGRWFDINGNRGDLPGAGIAGAPGVVNGGGVTGDPAVNNGSCLQSARFANGLNTGQYMAPVGEFIFPENTLAGFPIVPANFWQMGFMVYGERGDGATAPQNPLPW